ncbi:hypothetical protein GYMLUDRAFT_262342 [Collybiopsis luxurians FD-317 M1]|uniref:Uncharacterized protein n=1 Tax=Collybiopsis luxurians FD-317 M1 TaxID=944289 RepID=A0A0D0C8E3_9AGAR|nr:hypothetical protein GYMLUDRAFT_262342 [Collybiopsis luxurians FD-317 M1]
MESSSVQVESTLCPANFLCFPDRSAFRRVLNSDFIIPVALGLFSYGIFVVLFGLSMHVFRQKFLPGNIYVIATVLFFALATASIALNLALTFLLPIDPLKIAFFGPDEPGLGSFKLEYILRLLFMTSGLLSDVVLIHRCYHLWNSKKRIVFVPILLAVGSFGGIVTFIACMAINGAGVNPSYQLFIIVTAFQNTLLTGLIVGRVWWLNRQINRMLIERAQRAPLNLLWPVLISGVVFPLVLLATVINDAALPYSVYFYSDFLISPCLLTQIVGISSTLTIVFLGLSTDSVVGSVSVITKDPENHSSTTSAQNSREISSERTGSSLLSLIPGPDSSQSSRPIPSGINSNGLVRPYSLKFDRCSGTVETALSDEDHVLQSTSTGDGTVRPYNLKYSPPDGGDRDSEVDREGDIEAQSSAGGGEARPYTLKYEQPMENRSTAIH